MFYKVILASFLFFGIVQNVNSQDSFIKKIDKDMTTLGYQIELYEDRIFVLTGKVCNNVSECSTVMEIDEYGNILWDKELPFLDVSSKSMVIANDTIFLSGNFNQTQQKFLFHQMSVDGGEPLFTYDIVKPDDIYTNMFNLGLLRKEDKFYIFGPGEKDNGTIETTLIYVVNSQGELDTLLTLFPIDQSSDPWQMRLDNQGHVVVFIELDPANAGEGKDDIRKIVKLNNNYEIFWEYTSEEDFYNRSHPRGLILDDDRIVYVTGNENIHFNQHSLRALNWDSTISWQYYSPDHPSNLRKIYNLELSRDGNIFGFGEWGNLINEPRISQSPWIFKISAEGEMIWEHCYYEMKEDGSEAKTGLFFDAVELDDDSILAVGGMRSDNNDILIARFDSLGCLMYDCTLLTDVTDLLSDIDEVKIKPDITVYPNPALVGKDIVIHIENAHGLGNEFILEIYNAAGNLIQKTFLIKGEQAISWSYGKGMFYIRIRNDREILYWDKLIRI